MQSHYGRKSLKTQPGNALAGSALKVSGALVAALCMNLSIGTGLYAQDQTTQEAPINDKVSKLLLIKLSREQSYALCQSEVFTQCMGFDKDACFNLSEKAVQQCLAPLPDTIKLADLQNDSLEVCPQEVYAEAGYSEEKAQACLQEALKQ